jgi:GTP-binding protein
VRGQRAFVDFVRIHVKAGDGGNGCISFSHEKYRQLAGPDGGDGGRGGSVYLEGDPRMGTLLDFKQHSSFRAGRGQHGMGKQCFGKSGRDVLLKVPLGTVVIDEATGEELLDILEPGIRVCIAKGGAGGRGNQHFATTTNHTPRKAEYGKKGEEKRLVLELKALADVGLVGLPNAGKSTLLSVLSGATPRIGAYPFTTLSPNLGVILSADLQRHITLADIPGLVEGAHKGAGLGDRFLRHIERTKVLVHLVAPEGGTDGDGNPTLADARPETLLYAHELVRNELRQYSESLPEKPTLTVLTKTDMVTAEQSAAIVEAFRAERGIAMHTICAITGEGIDALRAKIEELIAPFFAAPPEATPGDPGGEDPMTAHEAAFHEGLRGEGTRDPMAEAAFGDDGPFGEGIYGEDDDDAPRR